MFEVPADIRIAGLRVWRRGQFTPSGVYELHAIWEGDQGVDLEHQTDLPTGAPQFAEFTNLDATFLGMSIFCEAGGNCPADLAWNTVEFTRMEMVLRDAFVPRAEGDLTGTALQGGELSGDVSLRSGYSDRGGGLKSAALLIDGAEVKRVGIGCKEPYDSTIPCPKSGSTEVVLDTRTVPDGRHTLQLALIDVAGNRGLTAPTTVDVRNGPPVSTLAGGRAARHAHRRPQVAARATQPRGGRHRDPARRRARADRRGSGARSPCDRRLGTRSTPRLRPSFPIPRARLPCGSPRVRRGSCGSRTAIPP